MESKIFLLKDDQQTSFFLSRQFTRSIHTTDQKRLLYTVRSNGLMCRKICWTVVAIYDWHLTKTFKMHLDFIKEFFVSPSIYCALMVRRDWTLKSLTRFDFLHFYYLQKETTTSWFNYWLFHAKIPFQSINFLIKFFFLHRFYASFNKFCMVCCNNYYNYDDN